MTSLVSCPRIILHLLPCCDTLGGKRNAPVDPGKKEERKREDKKQGLSQFIPLSSFAEEYDGNNHNDCNHDDDKNRDKHAGDRTRCPR